MSYPWRRTFFGLTVVGMAVWFSFLPANAFGAVLDLTTGDVVGGVIVERSGEWIKIDTGLGIPITYYWDEITAIDGEPVFPPGEAAEAPGAQAPAPETIVVPEPVIEPPEPAEEMPEKIEHPEPVEETPEAVEPPVPPEETLQVVEPPAPPAEMPQVIESPSPAEEIPHVVEPPAPVVVPVPETVETPSPEPTMEKVEPDEPVEEPVDVTQTPEEPVQEETTAPAETVTTPKMAEPPQAAPMKDVATLDGVELFKEDVSPAAIKPKEAPSSKVPVVTDASRKSLPLKPKTKNAEGKAVSRKISHSVQTFMTKFRRTQERVQKKRVFIKERLYTIPFKVRRAMLILGAGFLSFLYLVTCLPLMMIARKLKVKHAWLVWVPVVQIFYFVRLAGRPVWLAVFLFVPVLNLVLPFFFFVDILMALKKPRWLVLLFLVPGVNIFTLWYLAISRSA